MNTYLRGLPTHEIVDRCIQHLDPAVARVVHDLAQRRRRPTRRQIQRAAQLAGVPVASVCYFFGWAEDYDTAELVDLARGAAFRHPRTFEEAAGLLVWRFWIRPEVCITTVHMKH